MKKTKTPVKAKRSGSTGIGPRMRQWRKAQPIKGYEFAKLIKISQGSLSDIENDKSDPSALTLVKLYNATDINMHWLLTGEEGEINKDIEIPTDHNIVHLNPGCGILIKCNKR